MLLNISKSCYNGVNWKTWSFSMDHVQRYPLPCFYENVDYSNSNFHRGDAGPTSTSGFLKKNR